MAIPTGFQIGLEITNLLTPLGGAVGRVYNHAVADAIKRSGSDFITEAKLAAIIGRHRIDESLRVHFRNIVAPSSQINLSRYVGIALHAGAGPTIQEALKEGNPAIFSMIVQLSLLSYTCKDQDLAYAVTTAIESLLESQGAPTDRAPDYVSLLGTIRACRQQTTAFQWGHHFKAVESRLVEALQSSKQQIDLSGVLSSGYFVNRSIQYYTLKALTEWIPTLQSFPEERYLHIKCSTGLCTTIVWCHYVLDLNIRVCLENCEIAFGRGRPVITLEAVSNRQETAILYDAKENHKPLFTLSPAQEDPPIESESRLDAYGFGRKYLESFNLEEGTIEKCISCIILYALVVHQRLMKGRSSAKLNVINQSTIPTEEDVLEAGKFLFAGGYSPINVGTWKDELLELLEGETHSPDPKHLVTLLFIFSRLSNLQECINLPLSPREFPSSLFPEIDDIPELLESFQLLSAMLVGYSAADLHTSSPVLNSAWGWSVYLDCFNPVDPSELNLTYFRAQQGVPSRKGVRKTHIMDALASHGRIFNAPTGGRILDSKMGITFYPGVSSAFRGPVLIGQDEISFFVTQLFEWMPNHSKETEHYRLGFREMVFLRTRVVTLLACECPPSSLRSSWETGAIKLKIADSRTTMSLDLMHNYIGDDGTTKEQVWQQVSVARGAYQRDIDIIWYLYLGGSEASRWLQLSDFVRNWKTPRTTPLVLVHRKCCPSCAISMNSRFDRKDRELVLF